MLSHSEVLFALQSAWYEHNYVAIPAIFGTAMGLVFFKKKTAMGHSAALAYDVARRVDLFMHTLKRHQST
jgi:hypothetical protein